MLHHFKEGELIGAPLVKSTDFQYENNRDTKLSFLSGIRVQGYRKISLFEVHWTPFSADLSAGALSANFAQEFHE